jgi:hypothetical protein
MVLRLIPALWQARRWINATVAEHRCAGRPVSSFGYDRLARFFPPELLDEVQVVVVERTPRPPLEQWGISALGGIGDMPGVSVAGITFGDLFFVRRGCASPSLFFHELIHVIQWRRLRPNLFLALYGLLLMRHGYAASPLEVMVRQMQPRFNDVDGRPFDARLIAERRTDEILAEFQRESWGNRITVAMLRAV